MYQDKTCTDKIIGKAYLSQDLSVDIFSQGQVLVKIRKKITRMVTGSYADTP